MRRSEERILTTHVGSLPRSAELADLLIRDELGEAVDQARLRRLGEEATHHVVASQVAAGIDIVNDGEQTRVGFQTYVAQRMKGFGGESRRPANKDYIDFPIYAALWNRNAPRRTKVRNAPQAVADVVYDDLSPSREECRLFKEAVASQKV